MKFKCIKTSKEPVYHSQLMQDDSKNLSGDITIQASFSSLNYKDALAITGKGRILKNFPLTPGIDVSGKVIESNNKNIKAGDSVLITGCGLGETQNGGLSELVKAPAEWVIPLPKNLSLKEAMILGTAGFTAALCLERMEHNRQKPDMGPILVTGASGGVGSLAVNIFSKAGYEVHAVSGKTEQHDYLRNLGAQKLFTPDQLELGQRPLEKGLWAGAVDNVGGDLLSGILRHIKLWGNIASVGLAASHEVHGTVMPMILRGVSLLGISSANTPRPWRDQIWQRLAGEIKPDFDKLAVSEIKLEDVISASQNMIERKSFGRTIICYS